MKRLFVLVLAFAMLFVFIGCTPATVETPEEAPKEEPTTAPVQEPAEEPAEEPEPEAKSFVLNYSILEPNEHPQGICMLSFAEKVEELSGGQIKVNTHPSGSLFTQEGMVTALMEGDLDIGNIAFQDISPYLPSAAMFAAPYAFTSYEHMEKVFESEIADKFFEHVFETCNYLPIGYMCQGSRIINCKSETPIMTPEDMKGMILRMPNAPSWIDAGQSLGASVTPIAYAETYTALQTGVVEAQDNPLPGTYAMKFYEVTKQISLTKHIIDVKLISVSRKVWEQMTDQQKQWMIEAAEYGGQQANAATYAQEQELLTFMKEEAGMIITEPDIDAFQAHSYQYYLDKGLTADWDMDMYNAIQELK
ncbi:MAG: Sialic acid-binding periplasmic protein SiaP precursor [Firmicutes bacterium ADurb.Bin182]|nr:MAG: Sialic acid-binding periplasmic protein SiaP precursor [Firmicutes bacterium ADurb.Bin182]